MNEDWEEVKFKEYVNIRPTIKIEKGIDNSFLDMGNIEPLVKNPTFINRIYTGSGSKFENGDTIVARITPCLQNGKITFINNLNGNSGFGSGELLVFRPKNLNLLNNNFLYYYCCQKEKFRDILEGSMLGASGRQRVNNDLFNLMTIQIPKSLETQEKIAQILSNYDDLIENNNKRIEILEQQAKTIYDEWFVKFKFSGHKNIELVDSEFGKIPEGWEVKTFDEILLSLESGKRPKGGVGDLNSGVVSIGAENVTGLGKYNFSKNKFISESFFNNMKQGIIKQKDILIYKDGAHIGRKTMFRDNFPYAKCCINEHIFILRTKQIELQNYLFFWISLPKITQDIVNLNTNSAQPGINQPKVKSLKILIPNSNLLNKFDLIAESILEQIFNLANKNQNLRKTRDLLLPRLISGELDTKDLNINLNED